MTFKPHTRAGLDDSRREDVFIRRYGQLLSWALRLTDGRAEAEDLVQEAFIQFTRGCPDLAAIENLDGYLYTLLRNLHISHARRLAQCKHMSLSISDYDSAELGLMTVERLADGHAHQSQHLRLQVRSELLHICHYACVRKASSKAGSVSGSKSRARRKAPGV